MQPINLSDTNVAIQGYDPVSYFTNQPTQGNPAITSTYQGAIYYFASETNKAQFDANPEQYLPQYGGFCAVAVSEGKLVPVDPQTYKVTDGKLYLFYNGELGNTKPQWDADEETLRRKADAHWEQNDLKPA
ncbi:MAG: YHS domain-containing (seleno)protein [Scytonema sp. PMC 1069.18]|nr:YHS domain-containing (seleno)protein [Scytonema sp. PMC 1069.18]MEC4880270.1 YHS domain-containing (seleno)protein [Scytonema sp. PMC 1070.18]